MLLDEMEGQKGAEGAAKNLQLDATDRPKQKPFFTNELVHFDGCLPENKIKISKKVTPIHIPSINRFEKVTATNLQKRS